MLLTFLVLFILPIMDKIQCKFGRGGRVPTLPVPLKTLGHTKRQTLPTMRYWDCMHGPTGWPRPFNLLETSRKNLQ